ncbi:transmembrane sensor [Pedobacter africanus]|uniref:Ferric-dicitrate binding protein FerR (Iron transport regulator) n=1 Tax=Pedobacter africanus TaxID=151894 RepID=A0ACC6KU55_9SPHI|nr:FecR domain-containing protein [Pedobacter africanus]MDR6782741.1 ferric-dicitrate binding protein FerR (iron transport regulator) [Pedobacter africanus]
MENKDAKSIFARLEAGEATEEEQKLVKEWLLFGELPASGVSREELLSDIALMDKQVRLPVSVKGRVRLWPRISGIAAAVALITFGIWFYSSRFKDTAGTELAMAAKNIAPGKQGATLTLANGKKIRLTDQAYGQLAEEAGVQINKTAGGQVVYEIKGRQSESNKINTLSTAKGETYMITLPDKSKVWLNAASSLTYSASLNERGLRRVRLEGEAYFEVAKDKKHPFIVETTKQTVKVLGTHFNISSYFDDRSTKTTLIEGSVQINKGTVLRPGEQANILVDKKIAVYKVDVEKAIAWKTGRFMFENEKIESIMRQLARWYNVEVVYQDDVQDIPFTAFISKYDDISTILDKITYTQNIHFKIEGRRVIVMK